MKKTMMLLFAFLLLCATYMSAQNPTVSGVVTSEADGQPVIGAYVTVKGITDGGTITDIDG
ncbi:MAG: SusC/RagA family TonB-linked outer membrane protein, partial [Bacteroidales bacterium]|nr:SusC/RagA family TonB-linked outer membrane protein [Bacteroidales bacterium]